VHAAQHKELEPWNGGFTHCIGIHFLAKSLASSLSTQACSSIADTTCFGSCFTSFCEHTSVVRIARTQNKNKQKLSRDSRCSSRMCQSVRIILVGSKESWNCWCIHASMKCSSVTVACQRKIEKYISKTSNVCTYVYYHCPLMHLVVWLSQATSSKHSVTCVRYWCGVLECGDKM
jgi:hypothetical protein